MADIQSTQLLKTSPLEAMARRKVEQRGPTNVLTFPKDLGAHGMLMRFFEYTYGGIKGSEEIPVAEIMLPLPKQLQDSFKVNVGSDEIGLTGSTVAQAFSPGKSANAGANALSSFVENTAKMGRDTANTTSALLMGSEAESAAAMTSIRAKIGQAMDGGSFLARSTLNKIVPDAANGIAVGRGNALNPFATLVFKGVDLKVHNLEWTLSPESEEEARELKKIIRTLQQVTLPKTTGLLTGDDSEFGVAALDRGLLKYPAMVNIYLMGVDQNYYFKFKTSMISQLNIDYTPGGLAIQKGGKPSQIGITMTLNEAFIHTAEDNSAADLLKEEIGEAVDARVTDNLSSNDGESREYDASIVRTNDGQPNAVTTGYNVDEVLVKKVLPDGSTTQQLMKVSTLLNQGFSQAQIDGTDTSGLPEGVTFTKGTA